MLQNCKPHLAGAQPFGAVLRSIISRTLSSRLLDARAIQKGYSVTDSLLRKAESRGQSSHSFIPAGELAAAFHCFCPNETPRTTYL